MPDTAPLTPPEGDLRYRRVILKLSGESLAESGKGISGNELLAIAKQIKAAHESGCQIAIVNGGGNILRGASFSGANAAVQEATAHYMGMLATVINSLALQDALDSIGLQTRVMSALPVDRVAEQFIRRRAIRHLEKGRVIILSGGIGSPFVTTDTAAAQRALEIEADVILKATRVDGVYSDDPEKNPHAVLYEQLGYNEVIQKKLRVMDATAIALCNEHRKPILVFNFKQDGNIVRAVRGESVGTWIGDPQDSQTNQR
ncbi:UMP kinase [Rhodopirellula sp. JC740]|uniref:Uridylate kinase n=1 Tax=Rhodopirellula halodulae TaxID=2894198 RepID=A0ABS8NMI2_9BACT|nr:MULTISPECIES: UMP kinase [unclassified Rhodopirellula]MCC9644715.1 UMP kinase [Rhodopirellula sp. JC740]MCC9658858.1 UMP kinase [Rhodopirellula sp. JC737]